MLDEATAVALEKLMPQLEKWSKKFSTPYYDHEDLLADTLAKFIGNPGVYSLEFGSLRNYLFSSIRNRAFDHRKKRTGKWRQLFEEHLRYRAPRFDCRTPQVEVCTDELKKLLVAEIEKMGKASGEAFRLLVIDGLGFAAIAERMGKSPGCIKSLIYNARETVKESLSSYLVQ